MFLDDHYITLRPQPPIMSFRQERLALTSISNLDFYSR